MTYINLCFSTEVNRFCFCIFYYLFIIIFILWYSYRSSYCRMDWLTLQQFLMQEQGENLSCESICAIIDLVEPTDYKDKRCMTILG